MKLFFRHFRHSLLMAALLAAGPLTSSLQAVAASVAATTIDITNSTAYRSKPIPITLSGFSGEADQVLRFDLSASGMEFVSSDAADFAIQGSNDGNVKGALSDAKSKVVLLNKAYNGGNTRSQAHALANDIIQFLTGKPGIAGTKIAYKVESSTGSELFVSDFDGYNPVQLTRDGTMISAPAWSPDKQKLFYTSWKSGFPDIIAQDLATGSRQVFARFPGANFSPAISPDGRRVAMILSKGGSPDLYVCDIDGKNLKALTQDRDDQSSPCWSPDGKTICYVSRYGGRPALFTVSPDGGNARRLSTVGVVNATEPDWSPDGKTIVFTALMGEFKLCTVPAGGGDATVLAVGEDPCWAPNSRTVIFTRRLNNKRVLSLLDVPTKRVKDVPQISGSSSQASWAR